MRIWTVEMWNAEREQWEPTVGVGLTRIRAREGAMEWRCRKPSDRFRTRSYVPEHDAKEGRDNGR